MVMSVAWDHNAIGGNSVSIGSIGDRDSIRRSDKSSIPVWNDNANSGGMSVHFSTLLEDDVALLVVFLGGVSHVSTLLGSKKTVKRVPIWTDPGLHLLPFGRAKDGGSHVILHLPRSSGWSVGRRRAKNVARLTTRWSRDSIKKIETKSLLDNLLISGCPLLL